MPASHQRASRALAILCAGVTTSFVLTAAPSAAEPDVDEARERLAAVQEKRDKTALEARRLTKDLARTRAALRQTRAEVTAHQTALEEIETLIAEEAEQEGDLDIEAVAAASEAFRSDDPAEALEAAQAAAQKEAEEVALAPQTAEALTARIEALSDRAAAQDRKADRLRAQAKKRGATLEQIRSSVAAAAEELEDAQARARAAARPTRSAERTTPAPAPATAASGGAAAAVAYAMAQVGDTYVYGAMGPDSFDCSGLTMAAWAQGGVSLPHSSSAQMGSGTPVSTSDLQPGDLVFYYSPVSHVGIYVGNGQLVHAANPDTDVQITSVFSMPVSGAVRPG